MDESLNAARRALLREDYAEAEDLARRVPSDAPQSADALLIAGEAAMQQQRFQDALDYYELVPDDGRSQAVDARCSAGTVLLYHLHRPSEAEAQFRRACEQNPRQVAARQGMVNLWAIAGCRWKMIPHMLELIRQNSFFVSQLVLLNMEEGTFGNLELLRKCHAAAPDDPIVLLGLSQQAFRDDKTQQAERLVRRAVRFRPDFVEAQLHLGAILLESSSSAKFMQWHAQLPDDADEHPQIWVLRGEWARKQGEKHTAVRCYWEALRRDPIHRAANYQISQILVALGEEDEAASFLERVPALQALKHIESRDFENQMLRRTREGFAALGEVVRQMESLGRIWEAWGWCRAAQELNPQLAWPGQKIVRLKSLLDRNAPLTLPEANPALHVDLSRYPLPAWKPEGSDGDPRRSTPGADVAISFEDRASSAGLDFTYFNGGEPLTNGLKRMYEFTGGGVAVVDYDADGWPDIYLTQGCAWPPDENRREHLDRLYRNLGNGEFEDITEFVGVTESGFSQGATVGDFDSDGFPDLYVANIGANRLYRNNGDGTLTDVTDVTQTAGGDWTTSCLIADLNGDAHPDIYAVNYLTGHDVFSRVCRGPDGAVLACLPQNFPAAQDRLYLNLGDGRFEDVTADSGIAVPDGKGLGIVAADFDGSRRLSLFVANDAVPNFFFVNRTPRPGARPALVEQALISGLALNRHGRSEACMGVAAGDANRDGLIDLFVTNFLDESNTLYVQHEDGLFRDETDEAGLAGPSLPLLGFGTQFLDGELDGLPDLVVANGHVDDLRAYDRPYQMPPQFFRNAGNGRFLELPAALLGPYFAGKYLGRAVARIDWNRDGLEDLVVSHLDRPVALLTNVTDEVGHYIALRLRGVESARDAVGTKVELKAGKQILREQLITGDGYQASSERLLVFGLGDETRVDSLRIWWPSGQRQDFADLPVDIEILCVEGRDRPIPLGRQH